MNTIVLNDATAALPIGELMLQVEKGAVEVRDPAGNVIAIVLSPSDHEAWVYAEAQLDLNQHRDEVRQAISRKGGITTDQLLRKAAAAADARQ